MRRLIQITFLLLLQQISSYARTIYVDQAATGGTESGLSWTHAYLDVQQALAASGSNDEIWVASGTYYPTSGTDRNISFELRNNVSLMGGFAGTESSASERVPETPPSILSGDIGQRNPVVNSGVLDETDNSYHVVTSLFDSPSALMEGFTIQQGSAYHTSSAGKDGGGLDIKSGSPTIRSCVFTRNAASSKGAAISLENSMSLITGCTFDDNYARIRGGAIYTRDATLTITECSFVSNTADERGGALMARNSSVTLSKCRFENNEGDWGGVIASEISTFIAVHNSLFVKNSSGTDGGALVNFSGCEFVLTNCTFTGNSAVDKGGTLYNQGDATFQNCILWQEEAEGSISSGSANPAHNAAAAANTTFTNCLVFDSQGVSGWRTDIGIDGGGNIDDAPQFLSPTGPTDFRIGSESPAIDAGLNTADLDGAEPGIVTAQDVATDLAGTARLVDAVIDIGAYEYDAPPRPPTTIYVDPTATGGNNDGTSWADAFTKLQSALVGTIAEDEVWVAEGVYYPDEGGGQTNNLRSSTFTLNDGVSLFGDFPSGGGDGSFAARDSTAYVTTLSGDLDQDSAAANNAYHVVTTTSGQLGSTVDGFTITGGNANGSDPNIFGGGLFNDGGTISISHCVFADNIAEFGGAVISFNSATATIEDCLFSQNRAELSAGAIYNVNQSSATITRCTFSENEASALGGAIVGIADAPTHLSECVFSANTSVGGGGAVSMLATAESSISECQFISNESFRGGALYSDNTVLQLVDCAFRGNDAGMEGGAAYFAGTTASTTLVNCLFSGNRGDNFGGAVMNFQSSPTFVNTTFSGNASPFASAVFNNDNSNPSFTNCIVWNNGTFETDPIEDEDSTPTYSHCLFGDPLFVTEVDPEFAPKTNGDFRLRAGSPAINAGDGAAGSSANTSATDLAGNPRFDGTIDIGAYETGGDTFSSLFPALSPDGDENGNGRSNFTDYAIGLDPTVSSLASPGAILDGDELTFFSRPDVADVVPFYWKSGDLRFWWPMVEGVDYNVESTDTTGGQTRTVLKLLVDGDAAYFRQRFSE